MCSEKLGYQSEAEDLDTFMLIPTFHINHEILNLRLIRSSLLLIQSSDQLCNDTPLGSHLVEQDLTNVPF